MPIRVKCGNCKKTLSVKDHLAGKKIKCPACQSVVAVPTVTGQNGSAAPKTTPKTPAADGKKVATEPKKPVPVAKKPEEALPSINADEEALSFLAEEMAPKESDEPPKTIDFRCEWCDEEVHLPLEMGGKQTQCPNPECRRLIKVPLPKIEAKKDWRKMNRPGPILAKLNQPEQLENAWGTQDTTRAKQSSLAEAGALELPPKPPLGLFGWVQRGVIVCFFLGLLLAAGLGSHRLYSTSQQHKEIKEIKLLVEGDNPKITQPLLRAEAHRTLALLYLHSKERKVALEAEPQFGGARSLIPAEFTKEEPGVNEQLFLLDLALSEIKLAGEGDDLLRKTRLPWEEVQQQITATLQKIQAPEVQLMAMREVASRLHAKNQDTVALGVAGSLTRTDPDTNRPSPIFSQQIALLWLQPNQKGLENVKEPDTSVKKPLTDTMARLGYAEGYARQGKFEPALALIMMEGPPKDRLETCLGVASIALRDQNNREKALECVQAGLKINAANQELLSPWLSLQLAQLGERVLDSTTHTEDAEAMNKLITRLPEPFKIRAYLEKFLAKCEKPTPVAPEELAALEEIDKNGTTLALGWNALAQQHARLGADRAKIRKTFADGTINMSDELREKIRPLVDVGAYLGALR